MPRVLNDALIGTGRLPFLRTGAPRLLAQSFHFLMQNATVTGR